jgi:hypothetical protein
MFSQVNQYRYSSHNLKKKCLKKCLKTLQFQKIMLVTSTNQKGLTLWEGSPITFSAKQTTQT